jgi:hypothetical protein
MTGNDMTPQEIFNRVVQHLHDQGHAALDFNGRCVYRAKDGSMCAVGCLIQDIYMPEFDDPNDPTSVLELIKNYSTRMPRWFIENARLLQDLQDVHDFDPWRVAKTLGKDVDDELHRELSSVACEYQLDASLVEELFGKKHEKSDSR